MTKYTLTIATLLSCAVLQTYADTTSDAQALINNANARVSEYDVSQLSPSQAQLNDAADLVDIATQRMSDPKVVEQAKALVDKSERFVADAQPDTTTDIETITDDNGNVDLNALIAKYRNPIKEKRNPTQGKELPTLMVFVSSSMPKASLYPLAKQVQKAGGVLMMNGVVNGNLSNTILFFKDMFEKTGVTMQFNPTLFRLFEVKSVPQTIVVDKPIMPCSPEEPNCEVHIPPFDRMQGNTSLYYSLEQFSWSGDVQERALAHLNQLRAGEWNEISGQ